MLGLFTDHLLEFTHYGREGVGACGCAQHVVGIFVVGGPVTHGLVTGILKGGGACGHANHFCSHQAHTKDIGFLPLHIDGPHVDTAGKIQQGTGQCRSDTMLAGAGFGYDAGLAHALGQQGLPQHLIGLVGATMQQIFTLKVQTGLCAFGEVAAEGQGRRATGIFGEQGAEFLMKGRIGLCLDKGFFQLQQCWNQDLRNIHAAEFAKEWI